MPSKKSSTPDKKAPVKKAPVKKVVAKNVVAKNVVAKKVVAAKVVPPKALKRRVVASHVAQPTYGRTVTHHRVVLYETCTNCAHMPDRIGTIIGTLSLLVALLSGMVLSLAEVPANWQSLLVDGNAPVVDQTIAHR